MGGELKLHRLPQREKDDRSAAPEPICRGMYAKRCWKSSGSLAQQGGYHLGEWQYASPSDLSFFPNQTYPDLKYRELLQNVDFRKALSLAIDRELINYLSFLGQAKVTTQNVATTSWLYQSELDNGATGYNPEAAMALLDAMGLPKDSQGYRTFPDGTPIVLSLESNRQSGTDLDAVEQALANWNEIGLRTLLKTMSRDELWPRASENKIIRTYAP